MSRVGRAHGLEAVRLWARRVGREALTGLAVLLTLSLGAGLASPPEGPHPLDPLTAEEISAATAALAAGGKTHDDSSFPLIALHEPPKGEVIGAAPGGDRRREAFVVVYERAQGRTFEAVVDLRAHAVRAWEEIPGVQPALLAEEYSMTATLVRADPRWLAALRARGIEDVANVYVEPWPTARPDPNGRRLVQAIAYYRGASNNPYARPIEGLVAEVDLGAGRVDAVRDLGPAPIAAASGDLSEAGVGTLRAAPRPLVTRQPDGPSFEVRGQQVRWQNWRFRFAMHPREGLVLHTVGYEDHGRVRSVLYRASLSEVFVPYADPDPAWAFRNAFDEGELDLGRWANTLDAGVDVPAYATFFNAVFANDRGMPYEVPRAVALFERDGGVLWKYVDYPRASETRRARQLVLSWIANKGNYEYAFSWVFHQDGTLEMEILLTGVALAKGVVPPAEAGPNHGRHGSVVAPNLEAVHHQHWFNFRLDLDVDGPRNTVVELNVDRAPASAPDGSAFVTRETVLRRERVARRNLNLPTARLWKVVNSSVRNAHGQPVGYALVPGENSIPYAASLSEVRRRAGFLNAHLWVTPYDSAERYAAGNYVNQSAGDDGLPRWTRANRPLEDRDVVVWYTLGITHIPRPEDWPVVSGQRGGFKLVPWGYFANNPAVDLPRPR